MFQNFDLVSEFSVLILDFSDKKIVSFKVYNVTRKFDEYSDYTPTLRSRMNEVTFSKSIMEVTNNSTGIHSILSM